MKKESALSKLLSSLLYDLWNGRSISGGCTAISEAAASTALSKSDLAELLGTAAGYVEDLAKELAKLKAREKAFKDCLAWACKSLEEGKTKEEIIRKLDEFTSRIK